MLHISLRKRTARINILAVFLIILIIANYTFIWLNSAKVSKESNKTSTKISETIVKKTVKNYNNLTRQEKDKHVKKINTKVRSVAHFVEFIPLGLLLFLLVMCLFVCDDFKKSLGFAMAVALALGALVAASDEIHQIYIKGRSFEWKDIFVDTLGSLLGIVVGVLGSLIFTRFKKSKV